MAEHGTASCYEFNKCRCDACKEAKKAKAAAYYIANKYKINAR